MHAAMHSGNYVYGGTQHTLQHEAYHLNVTIVEIHTPIVDVCMLEKITWHFKTFCALYSF